MTLVDSNVLIDVIIDDPIWRDRSRAALIGRASLGPLFVNDIIFAEIASIYRHWSEVDRALADLAIDRLPFANESLHRAATAFKRYRRFGGPRTTVLPDFLIGAQAETEKLNLLTRDRRRYETYFPAVELIAP